MDVFSSRKYVIIGIILLVGFTFIIRVFYLQILDPTYKQLANNNVIREEALFPSRGLIFDRNNKLIVYNDAVFDLKVVPAQVAAFDTLLFCSLLEIDKKTLIEKLKKARKYSKYKPSTIEKQIPTEINAKFEEYLHTFPGFYTQTRSIRKYPYKNAPHILGYIGEVNQQQMENSNKYYGLGDYVGINGIEKLYEKELRGKKGIKYTLVDVHGREQGSFNNYRFDSTAQSGYNLITSLDIDLQSYAELLLQNKRGSIVAIEPKTGEILTLAGSPSYDPNLLTGRDRGKNFKFLANDSLIPLFNRPVLAQYPPGSTFKPIMALIGLHEKAFSKNDYFTCYGGYYIGNLKVGCHNHSPAIDVLKAIQHSCNAYFSHVFKLTIDKNGTRNGYLKWYDHATSFGLGRSLGVDLPNEAKGLIPKISFYDKLYGKDRWKASTIISLGIGQGEILTTPLQLANLMAIIANRGYYYAPHFIKKIERTGLQIDLPKKYTTRQYVSMSPNTFNTVIDGMEQVVLNGTARIVQIKDIAICGKTGTAENPHGKDHSLFVAFAPKENPTIAIAVIVENAGYGSTWAAPMASLMIERYLTDSIATNRKWLEDKMINTNLIQ